MGVLVDFLQHQHARLALELERLARQDAPLALVMIEVTRDADGRLGEPLTEATHKAIADAHAHGLAVTVSIDGELHRVQPGGLAAPMIAQDGRQKAADEHGDSSS